MHQTNIWQRLMSTLIHLATLPWQKLRNFLGLPQYLLTIVLPQNLNFPMVSWLLLLEVHPWGTLVIILPLHFKHLSLTWAMVFTGRAVLASVQSLKAQSH